MFISLQILRIKLGVLLSMLVVSIITAPSPCKLSSPALEGQDNGGMYINHQAHVLFDNSLRLELPDSEVSYSGRTSTAEC